MASAMKLDVTHGTPEVARLHIGGALDAAGASVVEAALHELEASGADTLILTLEERAKTVPVLAAIEQLRSRIENQGRELLLEEAPFAELRQVPPADES